MSVVRISTTTSIDNSGLASELAIKFNAATGNTIAWDSVGSGAAMDHARQGLADLVITHDRVGEFVFLSERFSFQRQVNLWNWFIIVGSEGALLSSGQTLQSYFNTLKTNFTSGSPSVTFVSRGPTGLSGTFVREMQLWTLVSYTPPKPLPTSGFGVISGGGIQSMLATLEATDALAETQPAYTMTDIGTWFAYQSLHSGTTSLTKLSDPIQDPWGTNQYVLMPVNPDACFVDTNGVPLPSQPAINTTGAQDFMDWMLTNVGTNNAMDTINNFEPDGVHQGFFYNAEMFPNDKCVIKHILKNL